MKDLRESSGRIEHIWLNTFYLISELSKKDGIINDLEIKIKENELKGQKEENFERNKLYFLEIIKNPGQNLQNKFDIC